jgi:hypothetical protein
VRCVLADYMINVFGPRPSNVWIPAEQQVGHGFAGLPLDNVGVQYGLEALKNGQITTEQFVDVNAKIGGVTIESVSIPTRFRADQPALANAYRSGGINSGNDLDKVAIIDLRGPDPGAFHDAYRSWAIRVRLEKQHGTFANHAIWFGAVPLFGDPAWADEAMVAMDRWLAAVEADHGSGSLASKIISNRPGDIQDRCTQSAEIDSIQLPGIGKVCSLKDVQTRYGTPRTVSGQGIETDSTKCWLKPLRRTDYYPIEFSDAQWARLQQAFPTGVCDWSRNGPNQVDSTEWQTYQDDSSNGSVVYGGRALGPAPGGSGLGWTSESFGSWRG